MVTPKSVVETTPLVVARIKQRELAQRARRELREHANVEFRRAQADGLSSRPVRRSHESTSARAERASSPRTTRPVPMRAPLHNCA
jgi:hypothetical protein